MEPKPAALPGEIGGPRIYGVRSGWIAERRGQLWLFGFLAVALLVANAVAPQHFDLRSTAGLVGFLALVAALPAASLRKAARHRLEVSAEGVRGGGGSGWIPWSSVARLRDRPSRQRVDLVGPDGPTGVCVDYQLQAFDEILARILEQLAWKREPLRREFARPWNADRIALSLSIVGCIVLGGLGLATGSLSSAFLVVIGLALGWSEVRSEISRLLVEPDALSLVSGGRRRRIPLAEISGVRIEIQHLNRSSLLRVLVDGPDQHPIDVCPGDADPFAIFFAIRDALQH